ncbi:MAG: MBOAT family protein [Bacteroidales bacterium]|nr:MBOAT family protein [Bacteroidales bacterium]MCF8392054.1 MBOAT family protein [Bacteroidales bacterium]
MVINIILVLLPLFFFKYFTVTNNAIIQLMESRNLHWPLPEIKYMLPIGISFYTFMAIGYTIDVYNEELEADRNIGIVALFISFFPLILSGPIERAKNMIPQFREFHPINYENVAAGLKMMLWGYFMKLVVADRIGIYVDVVYGNILNHNGSSLLIASILYPFQVYADLGGYSLIAIGVSKVMGLNVMQNFKRPFFATSMAEFWRRWHISLITWLTDYVYTPLSFSLRKLGIWGIVLALMMTFMIAGIWHNAAMTFVLWGLMQGAFLSFEALTYKKRNAFEKKNNLNSNPLYLAFCMIITFILFASSQIFGRAITIKDSWMVFNKIFTDIDGAPYLDLTTLSYSMVGILILFLKDFKDEFYPGKFSFFQNQKLWIRYCSYLTFLFIIILFGVVGGNDFIYFQF